MTTQIKKANREKVQGNAITIGSNTTVRQRGTRSTSQNVADLDPVRHRLSSATIRKTKP